MVRIDPAIHTSVMLHELVEAIVLCQDSQNVIVDGTLWLAGHASEMIKKMKSGDVFVWFDADERNLTLAREKLKHIIMEHNPKVQLVLCHSNFQKLASVLQEHGINFITGIYYDLWVSSLHFDDAQRGFSLRLDGPLDMRFDTKKTKKTAADVLNFYEEKDLRNIFLQYGEEPQATKIAARIVKRRKQKKFSTTLELCEFLDSEIHHHIKIKTRVFQALRIEVNDELKALEDTLMQATSLLKSGGNIALISFHSLEDRIVKHFFRQESKDCICRDQICSCWHKKSLKVLTKKPFLPTQEEMKHNPRSRSAKLRIAQKI